MNIFMSIVQIVQAAAALLPIISQTVIAIEQSLPAGSAGAVKLDMVKGILQSAYAAEQNAEVTFEKLWPTIQGIISGLITAYNASGLFKKSNV